MNLLAFLFLTGCIVAGICFLALCLSHGDQLEDILRAVAERIRHPRPTTLEELHRHWEAEDRIRKHSDG